MRHSMSRCWAGTVRLGRVRVGHSTATLVGWHASTSVRAAIVLPRREAHVRAAVAVVRVVASPAATRLALKRTSAGSGPTVVARIAVLRIEGLSAKVRRSLLRSHREALWTGRLLHMALRVQC
jgi:hypothetical protein